MSGLPKSGERSRGALPANFVRGAAKSGTMEPMLDNFDCRLLDEAQRDADRTAEELAERVALSPSAIARRLRRLRSEGWLARTIAIVSPKLLERRLRALVLIQLN